MTPVPSIRGSLTGSDGKKWQIKAGGGKTMLTTVERGKLTATMQDGKLVLTDETGGTSTVTIASVLQANGVIHESISGNISWVSKSG